MIRVAAVLVLAAVSTAGCGGAAQLTTRDVSTCLADRGVEAEPRGDTDSATDVLAFEVPGSPPARGFLIFVDRAEDAPALEEDIRTSARNSGSVAHTLRERNVIVHFFTAAAPTQAEQRPIRACLEE